MTNHIRSLLCTSLVVMTMLSTKAQVVTQTFSYGGTSLQSFTVPLLCVPIITIEVLGAGGGSTNVGCISNGGLGASMKGEFSVSTGQVLLILVGQVGQTNGSDGGGGGGSFVTSTSSVPLIVAGGGGGATNDINRCGTNINPNRHGLNASITTTATNSANNLALGGANGSGGAGAGGGAGGGFFTNGTPSPGTGGFAFMNGAAGSQGGSGAAGGYGGGGGGFGTGGNGGGGGGYSGGGTSISTTPYTGGGGGGSYNSGSNQLNTAGVRAGNGLVTITYNMGTPVVVVATPPFLCTGAIATLQASGVQSYTWSTSSNSSSIAVSPSSTTSYTVQGTNSLSCVSSAVITITVNTSAPVLSIANPSNNICLGRTVSLTATGALSYTWTGGVVNGQTFTPSSTQVYTVSGQNGCGITTATTSIVVAPLPVSTLATPSIVCEGSAAVLNAVSGVSGYTWQPVALYGSSITVAPMVNTIYTVTASDGTCSGTQTVGVTTKVTPTITAATSSTMICQGGSVVLTASGGSSYNWMPGNLSGQSVTVSPVTSTLYQLTGTNSVGCYNSASQGIVVIASPTVNIVANKTTVCSGDPVSLFASGANTYVWVGGPSTPAYTVNPTSTTVYTVTGTQTGNVCTNTKTISITAVISNVSVSSNTSVCPGGSTTLTASGATSYVWNGIPQLGNGNFPVTPNAPTVYTVVATTSSNSINCPVTKTVQVGIFPTPTITIVATKSLICKAQSNTLTATGAVTYTWGAAGSGSVIVVKPNNTTIYTAVGIDVNGCEGTQAISVVVSACSGWSEAAQENAGVSVYPNPSTGEITIETNNTMSLKLLNNLGQVLKEISLTKTNQYKIEVRDLATGIYFIVGEGSNSKVNQKIIVEK